MKLSSLVNPELVLIKKTADRDELQNELIKAVCRVHKDVLNEAVVRRAVSERSELCGTVFKTGIAIPHARLADFNDVIVAVGIVEKPFPACDEKGGVPVDVRMMVLLLTAQGESSLYLNTLSAFAAISRDGDFFGTLCAVQNPNAFIQLLKDRNIEVKSNLTVASVMRPPTATAHPEMTVHEAADVFYREKISYMAVVDDSDNFVGEFSVLDLFAIGIPDYASKLGNLKFLTSFEPFEELLKREDTLKVKDVMHSAAFVLEEDSPVVEAVMKLTKGARRNLPVIKNGKLSGIVGYMDILQKVLRA
ncbi:MAG: hypothetical protein Ta2A_18420 [Treponemataceae bacterium]|nr:MAG: hypothetical protein Ta2A_18420 [Treponemataceae bacterium]